MILQDLCMLKLHTILAVDRAGLVGEDGQTHHGIFDVGFLRQAPGMTVLCPASCKELEQMLTWAVEKHSGPVAIRYPRGGDRGFEDSGWDDKKRVYCHKTGTDAAIVTYGPIVNNALEAAKLLDEQGCSTAVIRLTGVAPLPAEELYQELKGIRLVVVLEETAPGCGIHEALAWELRKVDPEIQVHSLDIRDGYAAHGSVKELYSYYGLDSESIKNYVTEVRSS
jgi:1-deoxy-D-xylulose-5-phosphate synthase